LVSAAKAEDPYEVEWIAQIGTTEDDYSRSVAVDASGNVYLSGTTEGDLGGPSAGGSDAFLTKFDPDGGELWTTQIGSSSNDSSSSVAVDKWGNIYIGGTTGGNLGGTNAGSRDAFLSKFDSDGNVLWKTQIGTSSPDVCTSVAVDNSGNAFVSGWIQGTIYGRNPWEDDAFLSKFDPDGNKVRTIRISSADSFDHGKCVTVDASQNVYFGGSTKGDLGGRNSGFFDAFLIKFGSNGGEDWRTQFGTSTWDHIWSVAVDASGNAYVSGYTGGDLSGPHAGGYDDAFLSKFDSGGNQLWTKQIGTRGSDVSQSVAVDASGNAYIGGWTGGDLGGSSAGSYDAFLWKFDPDGNEVWTTQIGTSSEDRSYSVVLDASGNVYISGRTGGDLGGPSAGRYDAYLVKYQVPEPATLSLLALGGLAVSRRRRRRACK